jgi:Putative prokaryotic signal transducing protein
MVLQGAFFPCKCLAGKSASAFAPGVLKGAVGPNDKNGQCSIDAGLTGLGTLKVGALQKRGASALIELLRTNDLVLISRVEAILAEINITVFVADVHMSALEGSLPFLPRRVLVAAEAATRARRALVEAGLDAELGCG